MRQNIIDFFFPCVVPALVPRDELISAWRNVGKFKTSGFVGDSIIRVRHDHHFRAHPNVPAIAMQVDQAGRRHGARGGLVDEGKRQVERGGPFHVDGVESCIRTPHLEDGILRNEQDVRNVVAMDLIEMPPLRGQVECFSARYTLEIDDGVGHSTLRTDDQALEVNCLPGLRVADLRVFVYREFCLVRDRA